MEISKTLSKESYLNGSKPACQQILQDIKRVSEAYYGNFRSKTCS